MRFLILSYSEVHRRQLNSMTAFGYQQPYSLRRHSVCCWCQDGHQGRNPARASVAEEIKDIPQGAGFCLVHFGVTACCASDRRELFALDIEELGQESSGGCELICFKIKVLAFATLPVVVLHFWSFRFLVSAVESWPGFTLYSSES